MRKIFWIVLLAFIAVGVIFFAVYPFESSKREPAQASEMLDAPSAPVQKNITWEKTKERFKNDPINTVFPSSNATDGGLFVRRSSVSAENLLVKFGIPQEFYKYDAGTENIAPISESEWQEGINEISCRERDDNLSKLLNLNEKEAVIYIWNSGGQKLSVFGKFAMDVLESPKHELAVVLSSDGYRTENTPGVFFGGNGGETFGNRFVQILDLSTMHYVTQPLKLIAVNNPPSYRFCWTDDNKYVLAYEIEKKNTKLNTSDYQQFDLDFHVIKTSK